MKRARIAAGAILALVALPALGQDDAGVLARHEYRRLVMGTQARIVLYAEDDAVARAAAAAAFDRMVALDDLLTDWRPSALTRLAETAGAEPRVVAPDLFRILQRAAVLSEASEGAFDVTVGPLVRLWRQARKTGKLPEAEALAAARRRVGWGKIVLDPERSTVRFTVPGMRLDLGAIGKGYACDRALEVLRAHGVPRALVEIGGDLVCGDPPPGREGWRVAAGCDTPGGEAPVLVLAREAVATSGDTEQYVVIDGVRYSHIVDPRTGLGLTDSECVTVVAPSGDLADALASAVSVRGLAHSDVLLARFGARVPAATHPTSADAPAPAPAPDQGAWTELLDGTSLAGWTTTGGRHDGDARWSVEEGAIVGRMGPHHEGDLLYTERSYTSFELEGEVKIDEPFDSGIFLRMVPREGSKGVQVTLNARPGGEIGGLLADRWLQHAPAGRGEWRRDGWNRFRIRCTGFDMHIEVWLNGARITDHTLAPGTRGHAPRGRIGVGVHGDRDDSDHRAVRFRGLRVRELPVFGEGLFEPLDPGDPGLLRPTRAAAAAGWKALFDGESLRGWRIAGRPDSYRVENGVLSFSARSAGGHLETVRDFGDFRLRLDFRIPRAGNSGVFLRAARGAANPAESGCEIQILDDFHWEAVTGSRLQPWQFTGSLYGAVPPAVHDALRPLGEWNTYEILYQGPRLAVALNGTTLLDVDTTTLDPALGPPFARRARTGFIGLQAHASIQAAADDVLSFRNIFLQEGPGVR